MPIVSYDPATSTATDDQGRNFPMQPEEVPTNVPNYTPTTPAVPLVSPAAQTDKVTQLVNAVTNVTHPPRPAAPTIASTPPATGGGLVASGMSVQGGASPQAVQKFSSGVRATANDLANTVEQQGQAKTERQQKLIQDKSGATVGQFMQSQQDLYQEQQQKAANDAALAKAREETDASVDPSRLVDSLSTGAKIGLVVAAAIQGAFRGLAHQQNGEDSVVNILKNRIAEDIDAQKSQIESGRIRRGNIIAGLMDKGYDLKSAIGLTQAKIQGAVANMADQQAAMADTPEATETAKSLGARLRAEADNTVNATALANAPRVTTSFARPVADKSAGLKAVQDALDLDKSMEERGYPADKRAAVLKGLGLEPPSGKSSYARGEEDKAQKAEAEKGKMSGDEAKAEAAMKTIDSYGSASGLTRDTDTGKWKPVGGVRGKANLPALTEGIKGSLGFEEPISAARDAAKEAVGRLASGGVIGKDEAVTFAKQLGEGQSLDQIAARLNAVETLVNERRNQYKRNGSYGAPKDWE